jgi:hypothetical protein
MIHDLLAIPDFLKRKKKRGRPRKIVMDATDTDTIRKYQEWDQEKQKKYGPRYTLMLKDEAPRLGSGLRIVYVKEGHKWAHLTSHSGDPSDVFGRTRVRMRLTKWMEVKYSNEQYFKRNNTDEVARKLSRRRYPKIQTNPRVYNQDTSEQNA